MTNTIIAGHFAQIEDLHQATAELDDAGFSRDDFATYFLNIPGQHGLYPVGGDAKSDEGASDAGKTAAGAVGGGAAGAVAGGTAGALLGTPGGPVGALAGAGLGAYLGAFSGALWGTDDPDPENASRDRPAEPPPGPMVAVRVDTPELEATAADILDRCHARQIDRTLGEWHKGEWLDFDPREPIKTLLRRDDEQ